MEAYQLAAHVLDMLGIHEGTMMRFHQNYLNGGMEDEETYLADMKALEYDILYGDREVYGGEKSLSDHGFTDGNRSHHHRRYRV